MNKIIKIYYNWKAKKALLNKTRIDIAVEEIMKDWVTDCIISRKQEHRRKELVEFQNNISESQLFLKWLAKK